MIACLKRSQRRGVTLIELVLSLTVATMIMGSVVSAVVMSSRALPDPNDPLVTTVASYDLLDLIAGDLYAAESFTVRNANTVEFTVADRNNDAASETIRYQWSGIAGDPLQRIYNGNVPTDLASNVYAFDLSYLTRSQSEPVYQQTATLQSEVLLASFDGWSGVISTTNLNPINGTAWLSEYFTVTAPSGATQLTFTRAVVMMSRNSVAPASFSVGIHRPVAVGQNEPAFLSIGPSTSVPGSSLTTLPLWTEILFTGVTATDPARDDYCLVLKGNEPTSVFAGSLASNTAPADSTMQLRSIDAGATWKPATAARNNNDLRFNVYGYFTMSMSVQAASVRNFLHTVRVGIQIGTDPTGRTERAAGILNEPEVTLP